ncbi:hypothetical protein [Candidatus Blastococcus massiliensis]|uniref:hypothetical protein n=1 Tax=Candidatus Blastococcus massiliensis TaxID=1470358 RepID=UPI0004BB2C44|nr:hypothetical protein [Candidatus Blastococcus massiliensis]
MTPAPRVRRLRTTAVAAAALAAVVLTTGCDADAQPALPDKGQAKTALPAVAAPADGTASSTGTVDWKGAAYGALDCYPREQWVADGFPAEAWDAETVQTTAVDVTGDGAGEVLVQVICPAPTSTRANHVVVFDVTTPQPRLLGVLGDDLFHPQADVTTEGTTVTLSGPTVAGDDPYCCPGHWGTVTYEWTGSRFVVASMDEVRGTRPATAQRLADGEYVGMLHSVGHDRFTVDLVEWFEGEDAAAACRQDGVPNDGYAWCNDYYVRNPDRQALGLHVAGSATVSYLDLMTMETVEVDDVAELGGTYWVSTDADVAGYTRFRSDDGVVTELESIYTP